ncbi:hypothetical protein P171DRAFT_521727 [Karstenula rhodostoma CBS 690.94]|uniref:Uncharacterized protein n=1 Tax=Karstenula rhodostoma CBS 690.94 TaxID=1392251 RepID=A0A9P4PK41_9PLEO|nr:hypothetical protein P171DRAFT_521727 [Karstenula rhodostoma CBS 690.94]
MTGNVPVPLIEWEDVQNWTARTLPMLFYSRILDEDPWMLLWSVPRGIVLQQEVAELVETALTRLEAQGYPVREDVWLFWTWNWTVPPDIPADARNSPHIPRSSQVIKLKGYPHVTNQDVKDMKRETRRISVVFTGLASIHRDHPDNIKVARESLKRKLPHDEGTTRSYKSIDEECEIILNAKRQKTRQKSTLAKNKEKELNELKELKASLEQRAVDAEKKLEEEKEQLEQKVELQEKQNQSIKQSLEEKGTELSSRDDVMRKAFANIRGFLADLHAEDEKFMIFSPGGFFMKVCQSKLAREGWHIDLGDGTITDKDGAGQHHN